MENIQFQNKNLTEQNGHIFSEQNFIELPISENSQNNGTYPVQSKENEEQIQNNEKSTDKSEEAKEKKNHKNLKRRPKSEVEGRTHVCKLCKKGYLSYPALYTHYKLKHNTNNSSGRGRGRPKKEQNENEVEKNRYNPINTTFFSKEERTGKTDPSEINHCIDIAFSEIYSEEHKKRNDIRQMEYYKSVEDHPFLSQFKKDQHDKNKIINNEHEIADIVLMDYLNKMSEFCNETYYVKLIKFVTLYREHVNIYNSLYFGDEEYTKIKDAEDVPDRSNEFITDFLDPEGNNADFGFSKEESIDLTQNLCYWLYEKNFTCSKLSLINNEK